MKKHILFLILAFSLTLASCFPRDNSEKDGPDQPTGYVAVLLPIDADASSSRWQTERDVIMSTFVNYNYTVAYGWAKDGDADAQVKYIDDLITEKCPLLLIASVDTYSQKISDALDRFSKAGGKIVCYDRIQQNCTSIDAAVSASYSEMGYLQSTSCRNLQQGSAIEFLAGPKYDNTAHELFAGVMANFQDKLNTGFFTCPSGNTTYEQVSQKDWTRDEAYLYMINILKKHYPNGGMPSAIIAANDTQAAGVADAISEHVATETFPIITGLNKTPSALRQILIGRQTMTISRNETSMMAKTIAVIDTWAHNEILTTKQTINNGVKNIPYIEIQDLKYIDKNNIN